MPPESLSPAAIADLLVPFLRDAAVPTQLFEQLATYLDLLQRWSAKVNLTSIREPNEMVSRHFGESLFAALQLRECDSLLDLGSGAGFPGIPMQLLRSDVKITLAESRRRKAAFLQEVIRSLDLRTEVWAHRAEDFPIGKTFHTVALRAVDGMEDAILEAGRRAQVQVLVLCRREEELNLGDQFEVGAAIAIPGEKSGVIRVARRI